MRKVADVFSGPARCVRTYDSIEHARREMIGRDVSLLCVVDDEEALVGVLTLEDVIRAHNLDKSPEKRSPSTDRPVELFMDPRPVTVDAEQSLVAAARELVEADARGAPVVRNRELQGVVTPTDLLPHAADAIEGEAGLTRVLDPDPLQVPRHASLAGIWRAMDAGHHPLALVVEGDVNVPTGRRSGPRDGNVVGVVTARSVASATIFEPRYRHPGTSENKAPRKRVAEARRPEYGGRKSARHVSVLSAGAEDAMLRDFPVLSPEMGAAAAARLLVQHHAVGAPVIAGEVLGVFARLNALELWVDASRR